MDFLDKPVSDMSLAELQRLIRQEVGHQIPPVPAWVASLSDLDKPLVPPDGKTNGYTLVYNSAQGQYIDSTLASSSVSTDGAAPGQPVVTLVAGPGWLQAKWAAVTGSKDPIQYKVFARLTTAPTTADATYLVGTTTALSFVFSKLADGTQTTDTGTYHVIVKPLSSLSGGATGTDSADVSASPAALDGSVFTISNISAGNIITGNLTAVISVTSGQIQTAAAGSQRVVIDSAGVHLLDANGNSVVDLFTDSTKTSFFSGALSAGSILASGTAPANLSGPGFLVASGPVQPTNPPALSVTNGGSLSALTDYYVSYSWVTANELRHQNQADFEKDATTGINKIISTEILTLDSTNVVSGYTPFALKCVTAATTGSGVYLGKSVAAASITSDAPVSAGLVYTFSVYLMMLAGGANVKLGIIWKDATGAAVGSESLNTSFAISTTAMTRYSVANATAPAGAVYASCRIITQAATITTFWADQAQLEQAAAATTWAMPQETPSYSPAIKVTTTTPNKTISCVLPASPSAAATKARIYVSTAAFNAGGGIYQQSVAVSTTASTTATISAYVSTGLASTATNDWGFWSNGFVLPSALGAQASYIRPAQYVDTVSAQQGWTLEGNGRIRFVGPTMNTQFFLYDEFWYPTAAYGATATVTGPWTLTFSGTSATVAIGTSSSVNPGVISLRTGTTTAGLSEVATGASIATGVARLRFSVYFNVNALTDATNTYNINLGFSDAAAGTLLTSAANGIVIRYAADNSTTPTLQLVTSDAATLVSQSATNGGTAGGVAMTSTSFLFVEFEVDAARTAVNWWVNFIKQTAITTHIPATTALMNTRLLIHKTATGAGVVTRNLLVDTVSVYGDYVTG